MDHPTSQSILSTVVNAGQPAEVSSRARRREDALDVGLIPDDEVVDAARRFLERACPIELVRRVREPAASGHDPQLWRALAEGGWLGLTFAPEHGGSGGSLVELGLFFRESGRVLLPTTFASTIAAGIFVERLGDDGQRARLLPRFADGSCIGTVAFAELEAEWVFDRYECTARELPDGRWELSGEKCFVGNGELAGVAVVLARLEPRDGSARLGVFAVDLDRHPEVERLPMATFGHDRQSRLRFASVVLDSTDRLAAGDATPDRSTTSVDDAFDVWTALQAMEMVGGAEKVIDLTVAYVNERMQFGRPIGSFQAVQHHVANMGMAAEGALLAAMQALGVLAAGHHARREVSIAKAWVNEAYKGATFSAHQLFGGMGYVLETDLHLWTERAKTTELTLGSRDEHLRRLAVEIGL